MYGPPKPEEGKCNAILRNVSKDCRWILVVDSDEVWHEDHLSNLVQYLRRSPTYDRYRVHTINPYPSFRWGFEINDWKPRIYRWFHGAKCPSQDRLHQYVIHPRQKIKGDEHMGVAKLPTDIGQIYHLNALRAPRGEVPRLKELGKGVVEWRGGKRRVTCRLNELDINLAPRCIRELGREVLRKR